MTLQDPNWMTFGGEPITGRTPTRVRVISSTPGLQLNNAQQAFVAQVYRAFCAGIRVSTIPNGYHTRRSVGGDGTEVVMESNSGIHRMTVRIAGGGETTVEFEPSGIGVMVCYTSNALIPDYTLQRAGEADIAQPLILRPDKQGKWSVERVEYLAGGQAMWASQDKKTWFSVNATVMPGGSGFFYSPHLSSTDQIGRFNDDWTPESNGRLTTADYLGSLYAYAGRYVYRNNEAVTFLGTASHSLPPFIHNSPTYGKLVYHLNFDDWGVQVYVSKYREGEGLRDEDATMDPVIGADEDESGGGVGLVDFPNNYYLSSPVRMSSSTAVVAPDGSKAAALGFVSGGRSDYLVTVDIDGPTATLSSSLTGLEQQGALDFSGVITSTSTSFSEFGIREDWNSPVYFSCDTLDSQFRKFATRSGGFNASLTASASGTVSDTYLNRPYVANDGGIKHEIYRDVLTLDGSVTSTYELDPIDMSVLNQTRWVDTTAVSSKSKTSTISGDGYSFQVGLNYTVSGTYRANKQLVSVWSGGVQLQNTEYMAEVDITATGVTHNVLYWDPVLKFRVVFRTTAAYTVQGETSGVGTSEVPSTWVNSIASKSPTQGELVFIQTIHGEETEIVAATFSAPASYTVTADVSYSHFYGGGPGLLPDTTDTVATGTHYLDSANAGNTNYAIEYGQSYSTQLEPKAVPTVYTLEPCGFPAQSDPEDWADYSHQELTVTATGEVSQTRSAFNGLTSQMCGFTVPSATGVPSRSDFAAQYARDPKTDAIIMSVRHPNSGQSWMYCVTKGGMKDLRGVLGLGLSAQIKMDPTFPYNNLVSI